MNDIDLFIIVKSILYYNPDCPLPSDEEIINFIKIHKEKIKEICQEVETLQ